MEQVYNLTYKFTKVEAEDKIEVTMRTEVGLDMNKIIGDVISEVM